MTNKLYFFLYYKVYTLFFLTKIVDFVVRACEESSIFIYFFNNIHYPPRARTTLSTLHHSIKLVTRETIPCHTTQMANPVGRPPAFTSPEHFDALVDSYLDLCKSSGRPVTLTGMVLALGITSKNTFYDYGKKPEYSDSVSRARQMVELVYEEKLHADPKSVNGSSMQFALKNFGWSDKLDINHGGQKGNPVVAISADKLSDATLAELLEARGKAGD